MSLGSGAQCAILLCSDQRFRQITGWRYDSKRRSIGNLIVAGNQATLLGMSSTPFKAYCGWTRSCTTQPWETIVCWLYRGIIIRVQDFVHPHKALFEPLPPRAAWGSVNTKPGPSCQSRFLVTSVGSSKGIFIYSVAKGMAHFLSPLRGLSCLLRDVPWGFLNKAPVTT